MPVLFTVIILILNPAQYVTTVVNDTYYCGFKQKCKTKKTDLERRKNICCQPCECEEVCKERGTCCADKEGRNITDGIVKQQCISASAVPKGLAIAHAQWYYARTRCPATFTDLAIKNRCEQDTYKSLEDVIFVSSEDGSVVYKNKFCAICHSEKKMMPWAVKIEINSCISSLLKENINEPYLKEILLTECRLVFKRPDVVNLATLCFNDVSTLSQCNYTGLWDNYDEDLESRCIHSAETLYYFQWGTWVYKNLYCFLCNSPANVDPETCQQHMINKFSDKNLASLINFVSEDPIRNEAGQSNTCKSNQVLDTFFDTCRTLYCPTLSLPVNGQCVRYVDGEFTFCLTIRLIPPQLLTGTISVQRGIISQYIDIIGQVGFKQCKICNAYIYRKKTENESELSEVYLFFSVTVNDLCTAEKIWATVIELEKASSYVDVYLNQTITRLDVILESNEFLNTKRAQFEYRRKIHGTFLCRCIILEPGSACAKVKLTIGEYNSVVPHHDNALDLVYIPSNDDDNDTMNVCYKNYIVTTQIAGGNKQASALLVMIVFLMVSLTRK